MNAPPSSPDALYAEREAHFAAAADRWAAAGRRTGLARLAAFALAAWAPLRGGFGGARVSAAEAWLAVASLVAFLVLVLVDQRLTRQRRLATEMAAVNRRTRARLARDFAALGPLPPAPAEAPPWARELHLFGRTSLRALLGTVATVQGDATLTRWLLEPADAAAVAERQRRVLRLRDELDLRQQLEAHGRLSGPGRGDLDRFYRWAESDDGLPRWVPWVAIPATPLPIVALIGVLGGWLPGFVLTAVLISSYLATLAARRQLTATLDAATAGTDGFHGIAGVFRAMEALLARSDAKPAGSAELAPSIALGRLERLNEWADARRSVAHLLLQLFLLWDFHVVAGLSAWRRRSGSRVRGWLSQLGDAEAASALAALAHAQPEWAFPEIDPKAGTITARNLGHPLLRDGVRVGNDATLGPPGRFLFVTGSNMSGKTTFLRSLGANVVLAQAGGPVAAEQMVLPPLALATSIAVEDSLEEGVSFFLAELQRLKGVVDLATHPPAGRRVLYLLDEVLRGTNSAERRVAVARILGRLVTTEALGAITTHDLEVLAEGELEGTAEAIHFRETLETDPDGATRMTFDYRARPGLAPTTNALRLLAAVGLGHGS